MNEHQLILRMIAQMRAKAERLAQGDVLDPVFVSVIEDRRLIHELYRSVVENIERQAPARPG